MNAEKAAVAHNVDHEEIAKFEAVASRWWDLEGEFKPLHRINPLRLGYIAERSGGLFGKKVLDVGCGGGILAESMDGDRAGYGLRTAAGRQTALAGNRYSG